MLLANETVAAHLEQARHAGALSRPRSARSAEGRALRGVHLARSGTRWRPPAASCEPRHFQRLVGEDPRQARGEADRVPDAAHDAEGAVRRSQPRPLRPGGRGLHPLHVADPPLSRSGRAPRAARGARAAPAKSGARSSPRICRRSRVHTSERERRAADAERELVQWKKVRFMADKVGDEFEGYVTGVSAYGLYLELVEHFVEGMVHVSTMADDYYRFVERAHILRGENDGPDLPAGRSREGAGDSSGPRTPADRPGPVGDSRRGPAVGA